MNVWRIETRTQHVSGVFCNYRIKDFCLIGIFSIAVTFEIGGPATSDPRTPTNEEENETGWECVWKCHTATPVHHMSFSPDGTLFATSGKSDRLVKVWYENKHCKYFGY